MSETQRDDVIELMNLNTKLADIIERQEAVIKALKFHHGAQNYGSPSLIHEAYQNLVKAEFELAKIKETP